MVVTLAKLSSGHEKYYNKDGREDLHQDIGGSDYYVGDANLSAYFSGNGCKNFEALEDKVIDIDDQRFKALFSGRSPDNKDEALRRGGMAKREITLKDGTTKTLTPVQAFDFTCSAPKDISILYAIGDSKTREQLIQIQREAVANVQEFVQQNTFVRTGKGGLGERQQASVIFANFEHKTNRDLDPHLHTHCVLLNLGIGEDGKTRSLDARSLFSLHAKCDEIYQETLRFEIEQRLNLKTETRLLERDLELLMFPEEKHSTEALANGKVKTFTINGISDELREEFSTRRKDLIREARIEEINSGKTATSKERELARVKTRKAKNTNISQDNIDELWKNKANQYGLTLDSLYQQREGEKLREKETSRTSIHYIVQDIKRNGVKLDIDTLEKESPKAQQSKEKQSNDQQKLASLFSTVAKYCVIQSIEKKRIYLSDIENWISYSIKEPHSRDDVKYLSKVFADNYLKPINYNNEIQRIENQIIWLHTRNSLLYTEIEQLEKILDGRETFLNIKTLPPHFKEKQDKARATFEGFIQIKTDSLRDRQDGLIGKLKEARDTKQREQITTQLKDNTEQLITKLNTQISATNTLIAEKQQYLASAKEVLSIEKLEQQRIELNNKYKVTTNKYDKQSIESKIKVLDEQIKEQRAFNKHYATQYKNTYSITSACEKLAKNNFYSTAVIEMKKEYNSPSTLAMKTVKGVVQAKQAVQGFVRREKARGFKISATLAYATGKISRKQYKRWVKQETPNSKLQIILEQATGQISRKEAKYYLEKLKEKQLREDFEKLIKKGGFTVDKATEIAETDKTLKLYDKKIQNYYLNQSSKAWRDKDREIRERAREQEREI